MIDQKALEAMARELAGSISRGDRILLFGELGTGKSVFARAVLRELGVEGPVPSPSFVVDAVYSSRGLEIHHIDLYRLEGDPAELQFYGIYDILESDAVSLVEWADRLDPCFLQGGISVRLDFADDPLKREVSVDDRRMAGH